MTKKIWYTWQWCSPTVILYDVLGELIIIDDVHLLIWSILMEAITNDNGHLMSWSHSKGVSWSRFQPRNYYRAKVSNGSGLTFTFTFQIFANISNVSIGWSTYSRVSVSECVIYRRGGFGVLDLRFLSESCLLPPIAGVSLYHSSLEYFMHLFFSTPLFKPLSLFSHQKILQITNRALV